MTLSLTFFTDDRKYEESWSSDPGRDSQLEYRLTIADAVPEDSGTYTCITPTRHSHSVELVVKGRNEKYNFNYEWSRDN